MSAPSLSEHLVLVASAPALVGHPVVAGLAAAMEALARELAELREENAVGRHSGNSGQPPSQDTTVWLCGRCGTPASCSWPTTRP